MPPLLKPVDKIDTTAFQNLFCFFVVTMKRNEARRKIIIN